MMPSLIGLPRTIGVFNLLRHCEPPRLKFKPIRYRLFFPHPKIRAITRACNTGRDRASGDCYSELTAVDQASGEAVVGAGRYIDRYRRDAGAWRFEMRNAAIFFIAPLREGLQKNGS